MNFLLAATVVVIIIAISSGAAEVAGGDMVNGPVSVWIPEHRCLVKMNWGSGKCNAQKCMVRCSSERALGQGRCSRGKHCICTYYCHQPPKS